MSRHDTASAEISAHATMLQQRTVARTSFSELRSDLFAVGRLYGTALQHELCARIEVGQDRYEDALHTATQAIDDAMGQTATAERRGMTLAARISELHSVVIDAALEVQRRYAVARNEVPAELVPLVDAGGAIWPFVYPPNDERHEHDTNSGGACRNPTCGYHSDNADPGEEPF